MLRRVLTPFLVAAIYILSSGPVLGIAFRMREATHWDGFYWVIWVYYPLLLRGHNGLVSKYIDWWVTSVFDTVGPG